MIPVMCTGSSVVNLRNPHKGFECVVAKFYLAQFLTNDCAVSGLFCTHVLAGRLNLHKCCPKEQKVYETHLTNVPSCRFLPCAEWTLLCEPASRKSVLSAFEQQRLGPYSCILCIKKSPCIWGSPSVCSGIPGEDILGASSSLGLGLLCRIHT